MLYGIGLILVLLSASFVGGSFLVPMIIAAIGATLMIVGMEVRDGKKANTARPRP